MEHSTHDIRNSSVSIRNDNNTCQTQSLFYEYGNKDAPYTLKVHDVHKNGNVYISMYKVYMTCADEYEAADRLVGSQYHWRRLCGIDWFINGVPQFSHEGLTTWREDMRARDESKAKAILIAAAEEGNVNAAKHLYDKSKKPAAKPEQKQKPKATADDALFKGFNKVTQGAKHVQ